MKDIVFTGFLDMVEALFTPEVADHMLTAATVPSGGAYTAVGTYDYHEIIQLLRPAATTLDLKMPDMDGGSVLTALRADALLASPPVIVLTMMDDAYTSYTLGASDCLAKPIDPERLIMMLQPYKYTVLPAPIAVDAEDSHSPGQGQPSHERGYV